MLEIIEYIWRKCKVSREELVSQFWEWKCKQLVSLVWTKLHSYRTVVDYDLENAMNNRRIEEEIDKLLELPQSNAKKIEDLKYKLVYIHYNVRYELHNDYRKQLRFIANHTVEWTEECSQEWKEYEFSPKEKARIKIGTDVFEYDPEIWFIVNGDYLYYGSKLARYVYGKIKEHDERKQYFWNKYEKIIIDPEKVVDEDDRFLLDAVKERYSNSYSRIIKKEDIMSWFSE